MYFRRNRENRLSEYLEVNWKEFAQKKYQNGVLGVVAYTIYNITETRIVKKDIYLLVNNISKIPN